jgi:hypothetical protein
MFRELRALRPGPKEAAKVEQLFRDVDASNRVAVELNRAVDGHRTDAAIKLMRRLEASGRRTATEVRALGWTVCLSVP